MEPITLTLGNELAALSVLQAAVEAFLRAVGVEDGFSCHIELVLEEIFTNILDHAYLPGQRERVQVTIGIDNRFLALTMRFKGIPFDVDYFHQCADYDPKDMLDDGLRGIGLRLIRQFSNNVEYRNLGKEGQEIRLLREISSNGGSRFEPACAEDVC